MLQKAKKTAGNIDWKSLQVSGSISSSQCLGKTFRFLITFIFLSEYHQTRSAGRHYSGLTDFHMLSRLCNIRSNIIAQGSVPCGLKMQHTSGSAGAEVKLLVSTIASGESKGWQEQAELQAHGSPAQLSDTSMPKRTGCLLSLKENQKSGSIGLSPCKFKFGEFSLFSGEYLPTPFHAEPFPGQYTLRCLEALCMGWIGQVLRIV